MPGAIVVIILFAVLIVGGIMWLITKISGDSKGEVLDHPHGHTPDNKPVERVADHAVPIEKKGPGF